MQRRLTVLAVLSASFVATSAVAQVDSGYAERPPTPSKQSSVAPVATKPASIPSASPAPAAAAAAATTQPTSATADTPSAPNTITFARPDHVIELGARLGVIAGGELRPKGFSDGESSTSWIAIVDGDYIVHPFFTVGVFGQFTKQGYEQRVNGQAYTSDGHVSMATVGASVKGRVPFNEKLVGRADERSSRRQGSRPGRAGTCDETKLSRGWHAHC